MNKEIEEVLVVSHEQGQQHLVKTLERLLETARAGKLRQLMVVHEDHEGLRCVYNLSPDAADRKYFLYCAIDSMEPFCPSE